MSSLACSTYPPETNNNTQTMSDSTPSSKPATIPTKTSAHASDTADKAIASAAPPPPPPSIQHSNTPDSTVTPVCSPARSHFCQDLLTLPLLASGSASPSEGSAEAGDGVESSAARHTLPVSYRQTLQCMTKTDWYVENRWVSRSDVRTQLAVIRRFAHYGIPTRKLELQMVIDAVFEHMCECDNADTEECAQLFDLTPHTYSGMIHRACNKALSTERLCRVVKVVLVNTWKVILKDHLIFTRSHVVMLYERLNTLFLTWSEADGSQAFRSLVLTVSETFRPFQNTRQPAHPRAYRVTCLRRIHRVLITTIFNNLCCRGHFRDADELFAHNRLPLVPLLKHWLPSLDAEDAGHAWNVCDNIRVYCQHNVCRLNASLVRCPVFWENCKRDDNVQIMEMLTCPTEELAARMCDSVHLLQKTPLQLLQQFASHVQRRILRALVKWYCEKCVAGAEPVTAGVVHYVGEASPSAPPGSSGAPTAPPHPLLCVLNQLREVSEWAEDDSSTQEDEQMCTTSPHTATAAAAAAAVDVECAAGASQRGGGASYVPSCTEGSIVKMVEALLNKNVRTLLRLSHTPTYLITYYLAINHSLDTVFASVCPIWSCTSAHLRKWLAVHPKIPPCAFLQLTEHANRLMGNPPGPSTWAPYSQLAPADVIALHESHQTRMAQLLRHYDRQLHMLLQQPLDVSNTAMASSASATLHALSTFLHKHQAYICPLHMPGLVLLVKCLLMAWHMQYRTVKMHNEPPHHHHNHTAECAICYNTVHSPMRQLQCGHVFHTECMVQTVQLAVQGGLSPAPCLCKCPYCMQPVLMDPNTNPSAWLTGGTCVVSECDSETCDNKDASATDSSGAGGAEAYRSLFDWWQHVAVDD
jgi:hypothetical protein